MKRFIAALVIALSLGGIAHAAFGIFQTALPVTSGPVNMGGGPNLIERSLFSSSTPTLPYSSWYVPGNASPAVSTASYYLMSGITYTQPYDLDTMGSEGAAIKAANGGKRYLWAMGDDHPGNWFGGTGLLIGYSNDPQIWPDPSSMRIIYDIQNSISITDKLGQNQINLYSYWLWYVVYNPDSAGDKFYIYAECQSSGGTARGHQLCLLTTSDFQSVTFVGPATPTLTNGWTSFGRPTRLGVNSWEMYSLGKYDASAVNLVYYKYTSTDGWDWTPDYSNIVAGPGPYTTISGQKYILVREDAQPNSYLSLLAVNSNNVSLGTYTRISTGFGSNGTDDTAYPGPTYLQAVDGYEEDGIMSISTSRGFPVSQHDGTNAGPYLDNHPSVYSITASVTGCPGTCVLNVTAIVTPGSVPPLAVGFRYFGSFNQSITAQLTGTGGAACPDPTCTGAIGTYSLSGNPGNLASGTVRVMTNGGLWEQFVDQYYLITNATTAASAAPLGVRASCAGGVATVQWNNSLPHQNYRVYQGSSAGTQATLVGDVTGTSTTFTPPANQQTWIKVVTMNVTEQKSRVVDTYCSSNTVMVNKHVTRFINDGGSLSNINISFVASADAWLTSNSVYPLIQWWTDVRFGYKLDGSGFISKIYDLGTTYLPRGGDYTPTTSNTFPSTSSNTSYSATSFRGTTPSWVNNAGTARGYFGNGRANNVQRWAEITMLAAYQKPGTGALTMFGHGENGGFNFQHASGSSGNISFNMVCDKVGAGSTFTNATVPFSSATAATIAAATFDGTNMTAYLNGTPGTPVAVGPTCSSNYAMQKDTVLRGQFALDTQSGGTGPVLASGSHDTRFSYVNRNYNFGNNEAQATFAGLMVLNKSATQSLIQSWGTTFYN